MQNEKNLIAEVMTKSKQSEDTKRGDHHAYRSTQRENKEALECAQHTLYSEEKILKTAQ